jgi:hypothetical protein
MLHLSNSSYHSKVKVEIITLEQAKEEKPIGQQKKPALHPIKIKQYPYLEISYKGLSVILKKTSLPTT